MPTPDFIRELRTAIGHQLLPVTGVSAVVFDDDGRILLNRRADNGLWAVPSGICDPGEQPAFGIVREVWEETAVDIAVELLCSVRTEPRMTCPNGDVIQAVDHCFLARAVGGVARVNDDESLDVGWFAPDALPELGPHNLGRIKRALSGERETWFARLDEADAGY